ncbi:MAG TPA: DinB family protein [Thermoanaerobaculia bacterium]|nr:DinB family protein [Thermoanaerobaculia bacterium]
MDLISDLRRIVLRDIDTVRREIELYPDDESVWREVPGLPNAGGTLVLHLAGNLRHYFGAVLGRSGYVRDRPAEFATRGVPRQELVALIAAAHAEVGEALSHLDPALLDEPFPEPVRGVTFPSGLFFLHMAVHLTYHLGQLDYHRRMVTGDPASAGALPPP